MLSFKPAFSLSSFTFIKKLFSSSSLSAIKVISPAYLMLLVFLLSILIPACDSSSPAFYMMYSACKLNNQSDNILSIVCRYIYLSKYIIDGVSESNVSRNEQLLAFSGECMDLYYVTFCIVLYASLFYFIFFYSALSETSPHAIQHTQRAQFQYCPPLTTTETRV